MDFADISFNVFGKYGNFENWAKAELGWGSEEEEEDGPKTLKRKVEEQKETPRPTKKKKRHNVIQSQDLDQLESDRHEKNTKKCTAWAVSVFKDWLSEMNLGCVETFKKADAERQAQTLRQFYATVRTSAGQEYSVASFLTLRGGLNRYLSTECLNIISDPVFKSANDVFKSVIKKYRKAGKDASEHHPAVTQADMKIIRNSTYLSPKTAAGLVRKVWFDIQLNLARRGREGNRDLKADSFVVKKDENELEYVCLSHNAKTKNHKHATDPTKQQYRGFMFAKPGDSLCPVKSFKEYISRCPPDAKAFYLHPLRRPQEHLDNIQCWYSREPMGINYLGNMLPTISEVLGLSRRYTNHSIRSTAVQLLTEAGLESRQVMSVTGHKCESSLKSYWALSIADRRRWSDILSGGNPPASVLQNTVEAASKQCNDQKIDLPFTMSHFTINGNVQFNVSK